MGIELIGADALIKELKKFGPEVTKEAGKTGLKKTAGLMRKDFRREAPRGKTGMLRSSIGAKYSRSGRVAWIGYRPSKKDAKRGKKRGSGAHYYYKVLEFGRKPYKKRNGYSYAGTPPMNPFFFKTFGRNATKYANLLVEETEKAVYASAIKVKARQSRALIRKGGKL